MTKTKTETMGAHWKKTNYPLMYQLYRRVEDVASQLEDRRRRGWTPTRQYIEELYDIAYELHGLQDKVKGTNKG